MKYPLVWLFFAIGCSLSAAAHTVIMERFRCPIDGKRFRQLVDASGTQWGLRLDLKPIGPTPAPWRIPQCPKCRFVLYDQAIDKATVQRLKPFITSSAYRSVAAENSSYFCLASVRQFLGDPPLWIGHAYLKASWQVEADAPKCVSYLTHAYKQLQSGLITLRTTDKEFVTTALLCGELERRLGKFEEAAKRFSDLRFMESFKKSNLEKIIDRELTLIGAKDSRPHAIEEKSEKFLQHPIQER